MIYLNSSSIGVLSKVLVVVVVIVTEYFYMMCVEILGGGVSPSGASSRASGGMFGLLPIL